MKAWGNCIRLWGLGRDIIQGCHFCGSPMFLAMLSFALNPNCQPLKLFPLSLNTIKTAVVVYFYWSHYYFPRPPCPVFILQKYETDKIIYIKYF